MRAKAMVQLGLSLNLLVACSTGETPEETPPRVVVVVEAERDTAIDRLVLIGDVHGRVEVPVSADMPERIRELHVEEGDVVAAGDPIATLDPALPGAEVAQASAAVRSAEAQRDRVAGDIARLRPLVASEAVPRSQLEQLQLQLRSAEAQISQLSTGRRAASLRRARTVVRAPVDGTVATLSAQEGALAIPQVPLCAIVDVSVLDVEVAVVEQDFVRLEEGMLARVTPPALPEAARDGTIVALSPVLDPLSRTGTATVRVDNADGRIRPGMVAEVALELERREGVLLIPSRAVLMTTRTDQDRSATAYVVQGAVAERRTIRLGKRYAEQTGESRLEVIEGLEEGDSLVVQGQHLLRDGAPVRVVDPS